MRRARGFYCFNLVSNRMNRSQNSTPSSSSRLSSYRNSDGTPPLDLSVQGSPAPRRSPRAPRELRRRPTQPPNSPAHHITLPIDRIIQLRTEINERLEDGCALVSSRANSVSSSHPDLALDLSSVTDSCPHSERSSTISSCDESEWSEPWIPLRLVHQGFSIDPLRQYHPRVTDPEPSILRRQIIQPSAVPGSSKNLGSPRREDCGHSESSRRHQQVGGSIRSRGSDLIEVYVETVKNAELSKFFRPCAECGEKCCQCIYSPRCHDQPCPICEQICCKCPSMFQCVVCRQRLCDCAPNPLQRNILRGTSIQDYGDFTYGEHRMQDSSNRSSAFSQLPPDQRFEGSSRASPQRNIADQTADSGNSTLQLDDSPPCREGNTGSSGILSRQHVSLSVMQLATAAQCARILADSLESVLQLAREELSPENSENRSALLDPTFCHDNLLTALDALNNGSSDPNQHSKLNYDFPQ